MKIITAIFLASPLCLLAQPLSNHSLEAIGRHDFTGQGTFHRIGMLREQENTLSFLDQLKGRVNGQIRANTMLFSSDNIFNTPDDEQTDAQLAEFLGASLRVKLLESLKLNTSYDAAFFRHQEKENRSNDFDTQTFRQQLSYETSFINDKLSLTIPLSWQHSEVFEAGGSDPLARTWTCGGGVEFTWTHSSHVLPTFSYSYSVSDPKIGAGKHKHDFNLGVTIIPMTGKRLFITPSIQYSYEDFKRSDRSDTSWTPTLSVSWEPLKFLAFDAVGSYTDSRSNRDGAEFRAIAGTLFARLFWKW